MINFTGDVSITDGYFNAGFGIGSEIMKGKNPFSGIQKGENDIWVGNFEGVASNISCNEGYASKVFRISSDALSHLPLFDMYGFANNHAMQHGENAYWQTVDCLSKQGYEVFGTQKQKSLLFEYKGQQVSITGVSFRLDEFSEKPCYWHNPEYIDIQREIKNLPNDAYKVLFVHWGNEYINRPSSAQKKFAHWLVDAGFDLIVGMHPHVLQGYEDYKHARIYYSLGNFVFDMPSEACRYGAIACLDFDENNIPTFSEKYVKIDTKGYPTVVEDLVVPYHYRFEYLNQILVKEDNSEPYHREAQQGYLRYRKVNRKLILKNLVLHPKKMAGVVFDFIRRKF